MQDFDFLPARFHERNAQRRTRLWQAAVAAMFAIGVLSAATGQYLLRRSVEVELAAIRERHEFARDKERQLQEMRRELVDANETAALFAYLWCPWLPSQVLAQLVGPLPESVALAELSMQQRMAVEQQQRGKTGAAPAVREPASAAARDLAGLRRQFAPRDMTIALQGRARDIAALHEYVAALGGSPMFASAKLESLESDPGVSAATFSLRLQVKQGIDSARSPDRIAGK
jgi:hypothetical protein